MLRGESTSIQQSNIKNFVDFNNEITFSDEQHLGEKQLIIYEEKKDPSFILLRVYCGIKESLNIENESDYAPYNCNMITQFFKPHFEEITLEDM